MELINTGFYSHRQKNCALKQRCAQNFEFEICTTFGSTAYINQKAFLRRPDAVYVGKPDEVRYSKGDFDCYFLYLKASAADGVFFQYLNALPSCIPVRDGERFIQYMRDFYFLYNNVNTSEQEMLLQLKMQSFILELYLSKDESSRLACPTKHSALYHDADAYILAHYKEPITVSHVAAQLGISVGLLYKVFRECAGMTPCARIRDKRLEFAKNEISFTDKPISQISLECGFSEGNYLNYAFVKAFRMTPLQFRRMVRK